MNSMVKVFRCINTSETLEQLETTRKVMNNFFRMYEIDILNQLEIKHKYEIKYNELIEGVYG